MYLPPRSPEIYGTHRESLPAEFILEVDVVSHRRIEQHPFKVLWRILGPGQVLHVSQYLVEMFRLNLWLGEASLKRLGIVLCVDDDRPPGRNKYYICLHQR